MFRFSKPETPRAALFVFLRNETRAKSGFVSYVSISLCFDFDPSCSFALGFAQSLVAHNFSLFQLVAWLEIVFSLESTLTFIASDASSTSIERRAKCLDITR